jgi:hypothetical protein
MAEETKTEETKKELVMCYISKQTVPVSETVEVQYSADKKYRVLPKYIRY